MIVMITFLIRIESETLGTQVGPGIPFRTTKNAGPKKSKDLVSVSNLQTANIAAFSKISKWSFNIQYSLFIARLRAPTTTATRLLNIC